MVSGPLSFRAIRESLTSVGGGGSGSSASGGDGAPSRQEDGLSRSGRRGVNDGLGSEDGVVNLLLQAAEVTKPLGLTAAVPQASVDFVVLEGTWRGIEQCI